MKQTTYLPRYKLLKTEPSDWEGDYGKYYENKGTATVPVYEAVEGIVVEDIPEGIDDFPEDVGIPTKIIAPEWQEGKYFERQLLPTTIDVPDEQEPEIVIPPEVEIAQLKQRLADTDYKAIKYAEGWYTDEEYATVKQEREALREKIRGLENDINN